MWIVKERTRERGGRPARKILSSSVLALGFGERRGRIGGRKSEFVRSFNELRCAGGRDRKREGRNGALG